MNAGPYKNLENLKKVELGDIIELPDGRCVTVRSIEKELTHPVGTMSGYIIAGEVGPESVLISLPVINESPVIVYIPRPSVPANARGAKEIIAGVVSYWSPHLPGLSGAMGELGYKICLVKGNQDPMVLVWRGRELVVYVKSAVLDPGMLKVQYLRRDPRSTEVDVERLSAAVVSPADVNPESHKESLTGFKRFIKTSK